MNVTLTRGSDLFGEIGQSAILLATMNSYSWKVNHTDNVPLRYDVQTLLFSL